MTVDQQRIMRVLLLRLLYMSVIVISISTIIIVVAHQPIAVMVVVVMMLIQIHTMGVLWSLVMVVFGHLVILTSDVIIFLLKCKNLMNTCPIALFNKYNQIQKQRQIYFGIYTCTNWGTTSVTA